MLITEENVKIWYREYLKQFDKTTKYVKSRKGQVRGAKPSSYHWFKTDFMSEVKDPSVKSGKQLAQKMAKSEVFTVSSKQAKQAAEAFSKKTGKPFTPTLIASFKLNLFEQTEAYRASLDPSLSSTEKNKLVAQNFFGSL